MKRAVDVARLHSMAYQLCPYLRACKGAILHWDRPVYDWMEPDTPKRHRAIMELRPDGWRPGYLAGGKN